jgi:hypothetical protein
MRSATAIPDRARLQLAALASLHALLRQRLTKAIGSDRRTKSSR